MLNKIAIMLTKVLFPKTYLEDYLEYCKEMEFRSRFSPRVIHMNQTFSPLHYKDSFVRDCIIELKERNNKNVPRLVTPILGGWILRTLKQIYSNNPIIKCFIVPVPQHQSKTSEKGFCHTITLATHLVDYVSKRTSTRLDISTKECVKKVYRTKRLHDLSGKKSRFKTIKNTMKAFITKEDAGLAYFFIVDDVYTTGATFKEMRRCLLDSGASSEKIFFVSIAH